MTEGTMEYSDNKKEMYEEAVLQMKGLFEDCPYIMANLANASALLNQAMKDINWVGFYLMERKKSVKNASFYLLEDGKSSKQEEMEEELLVLGPFQGKPACVEIKIGKGVCGTAVAKDEIMSVKNVHEFPGHIACDGASNSEIVLPIHVNGKIVGVLDIDSPLFARFDEEDRAGLEKIVKVIEEMYQKSKRGECSIIGKVFRRLEIEML